jgi:hypothetical protein
LRKQKKGLRVRKTRVLPPVSASACRGFSFTYIQYTNTVAIVAHVCYTGTDFNSTIILISLSSVLKKMDYIATRIDRQTDNADVETLQRALRKLINFAYGDAQRGRVNAAFEQLDKIERALTVKDDK